VRKAWEREQALWQREQALRVEEVDSDDTDTQGVGLNNFGQKRFVSDPLQFTGIDMAPKSIQRRGYIYDDDESDDSGDMDSDDGGGIDSGSMQIALRDKEEALVQSALARIRRAQAKGKSEVKLNKDELLALENHRKRKQAAAAQKERRSSGSRGGSDSDRRRRSSTMITVPIAQAGPSKRSSRSRKGDESPPHPPAATQPPGMLVAGPDGTLTYAPIGYYPPSTSSRDSPSRNRPRSATVDKSHGPPPPLPYPYGQSSRHLSDGNRPMSSGPNSPRFPLPHEEEWRPSSRSSRSSVGSQGHPVDPFEYQISPEAPPPIPKQYQNTGRRNVSAPMEVAYSTVRRSPPMPSGYPAQDRASGFGRSWENLRSRQETEVPDSQESSSGEDDESDDLGNGVKVIVEEPSRPVPARKPVGGKKKGKGR